MKYLCDEMCADLAKWLRAAGYDTAIASPATKDCEVLKQAVEEGRLLLTRDEDFLVLDPEKKTVIYLQGDSLDDWAWQLSNQGCNFFYKPFSRCLKCNTEVKKVKGKELWNCPLCHQDFWLGTHTEHMEQQLRHWSQRRLRIGFGGDLMIGRLIDEVLDQRPFSFIWGTLHPILRATDFNIANLETTLTRSEKIVEKVFNFKASPEKVAALVEGPIHAVNLANNHILDFSEEGLLETVETLDRAGILHVGAGKDLPHARLPCILEKNGIKIGLLGCTDNEATWKAGASHPGTNYLKVGDIEALRESILALRKKVDILILSIHWGPNMRQRPTKQFQSFAHELIDLGVDILHGHSAHVFQGVEIYKGKLILYDTGDFFDDYAANPLLRNDQTFFFIVDIDKEKPLSLRMIPLLISAKFQVNVVKDEDQIKKMEDLCAELKTHPIRQNHSLFLPL